MLMHRIPIEVRLCLVLSPSGSVHKLTCTMWFQIAPNLKLQAVLAPRHFDKMKVSSALHIFSHSVAKGIEFVVESNCMPLTAQETAQAKDTAWFISTMNHWFDLMSSRSPVMALSHHRPEKYEEAVTFLKMVIRIFTSIKVCIFMIASLLGFSGFGTDS